MMIVCASETPKPVHQADVHTIQPIQVFPNAMSILRHIFIVPIPVLAWHLWQFTVHRACEDISG